MRFKTSPETCDNMKNIENIENMHWGENWNTNSLNFSQVERFFLWEEVYQELAGGVS